MSLSREDKLSRLRSAMRAAKRPLPRAPVLEIWCPLCGRHMTRDGRTSFPMCSARCLTAALEMLNQERLKP